MKKSVLIGAIALVVVLVGWSRIGSTVVKEDDPNIVSRSGLHWHPKLNITIEGQRVRIPANIGLIGGHSPMHTHEEDGTIHLEYGGMVRKSDITLGQFFDLWGKEFSESQIFEYTNTGDRKVRMYINGEESNAFRNYVFEGDDEIDIVYE